MVPNPEPSSWSDKQIPVPCGKCPPCMKRRVNEWCFRLEKERELYPRSYFLTYTYSDENLVYTANGLPTLYYPDLQKSFKRLRKATKGKFSYYLVGEYGTLTERPHYHVLMFASDEITEEAIIKSWINPADSFINGHIEFGEVTQGSMRYCLNYFNKGRKIPVDDNDDRLPEFSAMSKGIGLKYLDQKIVKYILDHPEKQTLMLAGQRMPIPRYYKKKIFFQVPDEVVELNPALAVYLDDLDQKRKLFIENVKKLNSYDSERNVVEHDANRDAYIREYAKNRVRNRKKV